METAAEISNVLTAVMSVMKIIAGVWCARCANNRGIRWFGVALAVSGMLWWIDHGTLMLANVGIPEGGRFVLIRVWPILRILLNGVLLITALWHLGGLASRNPALLTADASVVQSLKRTKPLDDPVAVYRWLAGFSALFTLAMLCVFAGHLDASALKSDQVGLELVSLVAGLCFAAVFHLALPSGNGRRAFLVRAFRADRTDDQLRRILGAVIGPDGRLLGIRAPRLRASWFERVFAGSAVALNYVGSNDCELEAGDRNWLSRVLATLYFKKVDFAVIDLRDITIHVHREIALVVRALYVERCLFVVDSSRSDAEWRQTVNVITEGCAPVPEAVQLFSPGADNEEGMKADARVVESFFRKAESGISGDINLAHNYAQKHVDKNSWETGWHETFGKDMLLLLVIMVGTAFTESLLELGSRYGGLMMIGGLAKVLKMLAMPLLITLFLIFGFRAMRRRVRAHRSGWSLCPAAGWQRFGWLVSSMLFTVMLAPTILFTLLYLLFVSTLVLFNAEGTLVAVLFPFLLIGGGFTYWFVSKLLTKAGTIDEQKSIDQP